MKSNFNNFFIVFLGNLVHLISTIGTALVLPLIFEVDSYGYLKLFSLYFGYVGLFHFGILDGIYLKFAGINIKSFDLMKFRSIYYFFIFTQIIFLFIGLIFSFLLLDGNFLFVSTMIFLNLISQNNNTFFQFLSQILLRFKEYSTRMILLAFSNIFIILYCLLFNIKDYKFYIILLTFSYFIFSILYLFKYRRFVLGPSLSIISIKSDIIDLFNLGIPLMLSNLIGMYITSLNKIVVSIFFVISIFGVYSFAYNFIGVLSVLISSINIVLYPTLNGLDAQKLVQKYENLNIIVIFIVLYSLLGYFVLSVIIPIVFPKFLDSVLILQIAFPGLVFSSTISAIKFNYFKFLKRIKSYLWISFLFLMLNSLLYFIVNIFYPSVYAITWVSIITIALWSLILDIYLSINFKTSWKKSNFIMFIGVFIYYFSSSLEDKSLGGILFFIFISALFLIFYSRILISLFSNKNKVFSSS